MERHLQNDDSQRQAPPVGAAAPETGAAQQVPSMRLVDVPIGTLQETVVKALRLAGAPAERARKMARDLVANELDGYRDHGLQQVPDVVAALEDGILHPETEPRVEQVTERSWKVDGRGCFASDAGTAVAETLIRGAREGGMACVSLRTDTPLGRLAAIAGPVADAGLVVLGFSNASGDEGRVVPPGGREGRLGSNPMVFAAPCGEPLGNHNAGTAGATDHDGDPARTGARATDGENAGEESNETPPGPVIVDLTTSTVSEGEVRDRVARWESVPEGWLVDREGQPVRRGEGLVEEPPTAFLSPLGGRAAREKGFGLGLMVEILAGVLTGAGFSGGAEEEGADTRGALFVALSPTVTGRDEGAVRKDVERLARHLQASGQGDRVRIPGWGAGARRRKVVLHGSLAVPTGLWAQVLRLSEPRPEETPATERTVAPPTLTTAEVAARWNDAPRRRPLTANRISPPTESSAPLAPAAAGRHRSGRKGRLRRRKSAGGGNGGAPAAGEGDAPAKPPMAAKPRR